MMQYSVWDGIDRRSFFENSAFWSSIEYHPQENAVKTWDRLSDRKTGQTSQVFPLMRSIPKFLDDFALLASGAGEPQNVTAVCLELSEDRKQTILRVARNVEMQSDAFEGMKDVITSAIGSFNSGKLLPWTIGRVKSFGVRLTRLRILASKSSCPKRQTIQKAIYSCRQRIERRIRYLNNQLMTLPNCGCSLEDGLEPYMELSSGGRPQGRASDTCSHENLELLRKKIARFLNSSTTDRNSDLIQLSKLADVICRADGDRCFVQAGQRHRSAVRISLQDTPRIFRLLHEISRIYQAAFTIAGFFKRIKRTGRKIAVKVISVEKIPVPELAEQKASQIYTKVENQLNQANPYLPCPKLEQVPHCRQHAELQSIVFYEENPFVRLQSNCIGCSQSVCHLCLNFIKQDAGFEVNAARRSSSALWTVTDAITFRSLERAQVFRSALNSVIHGIEEKTWQMRATFWHHSALSNVDKSLDIHTGELSPPTLSRRLNALRAAGKVSLRSRDKLTSGREDLRENSEEDKACQTLTETDELESPSIAVAISIRSSPPPTIVQIKRPLLTGTASDLLSFGANIPNLDAPSSSRSISNLPNKRIPGSAASTGGDSPQDQSFSAAAMGIDRSIRIAQASTIPKSKTHSTVMSGLDLGT